MKLLLQTTVLTFSLLVSGPAYLEGSQAFPFTSEAGIGIIYASQPGRATLDQGEDGGNPFASALIELPNKPSLSLDQLLDQMVTITYQKSGGYQLPDVSGIRAASNWKIKPNQSPKKNIALVATFSRYDADGISWLPGAERDRIRVSNALRAAGFKVATVANPTKGELEHLLHEMAVASKDADAAFIYVTGHGFEDQGRVYLAPSNYHFNPRKSAVNDGAIYIGQLGSGLQAKQANLVFFGGCRTRLL